MTNESKYGAIDIKSERSQRHKTFFREITGLFLIATALFILTSIISYSCSDVGQKNWMGPAGAIIASLLFDIFGYARWIIPVPLFLAATFMFCESIRDNLPPVSWLLPGWTITLISTSALLSLFQTKTGDEAGGLIGVYVLLTLKKLVGAGGAILFLIVFLIAGLMSVTPFTLKGTISYLSYILRKKKPYLKDQDRRLKTKNTSIKDSQGIKTKTGDEEEIYPKIVEQRRDVPEKNRPKDMIGSVDNATAFQINPVKKGEFSLPPLDLLNEPPIEELTIDKTAYYKNARVLEQKLLDFGVAGKVDEICPGPVVTMYEYGPAPGVKINKVASLADDLALALKTQSVRIVAPIPGKAVIGIELANPTRQTVYLKEILEDDMFQGNKCALPLALGKDIVGKPVVTDLARMPHLLIAGATGTGKSVGLNAMICSLLYRHHPDRLRFLMVDPKRIELSLYDGIPHLLHPVVSEPKEATKALRWVVMEMERRYKLLEEAKARNLDGYNKTSDEPLPYLVVIIDELADLMMVSSKEVESAIARLAQMARAAGIHLLVATQRPSVDVLTGLIKANFPARISFKVSSKVDSRTILDVTGAERLLGMGDMLFLPPGTSSLQRIHGAYVSEKEIVKIVAYLKAQGEPQYDFSVVEAIPGEEDGDSEGRKQSEYKDELYEEAVEILKQSRQASISMLQRRLRIGYNRSARMIEQMEKDGIVGPPDSMGRRQVLLRNQ
ncbi:MAG: DNA translocase FtsK [Dissulfurimicrobium sp.]|uniref:DNA translocase FtsK n=1 Tax=Dissulfurimicrobium sp. TaxID=2022436 RepID=UPI00404B68C5